MNVPRKLKADAHRAASFRPRAALLHRREQQGRFQMSAILTASSNVLDIFDGGLCKFAPSPPAPFFPINPLTKRLSMFVNLGPEQRIALEAMCSTRRIFQTHDSLVREGSRPNRVYVILSGVAYRYRYLVNGRRQILGYLLPGDICDTQFLVLNECDHNVGVLCDTEVAVISLHAMMNVVVQFPTIERALQLMSITDAAMLRQWLLNVGQRDAGQKIAHFLCEMSARYRALGLSDDTGDLLLPITQIELADTIGLTVVHVNRILQGFRRVGMVNWSRHNVRILDHAELERIADFDATYFQLRGRVSP